MTNKKPTKIHERLRKTSLNPISTSWHVVQNFKVLIPSHSSISSKVRNQISQATNVANH